MTTRRTWVWLEQVARMALIVLGLGAAMPVWADAPRHLLPAVAADLEAAIGQGGALQLVDGHVNLATAQLKVCQGPGLCADVTLGDPQTACAGTTSGAWCLQFTGTPPAFAAALQQRLAKMPAAAVWRASASQKAAPTVQPKPEPDVPWIWPAALAWLLVPLLAGWVIGRLAQPRRRARVWAGLVVAATLFTLGLTLAFLPQLGAWDFLLAASLLTGAALWFADPPKPSPRRRQVLTALLALAVLAEIASRLGTAPPLVHAPLPGSVRLPPELENAVTLSADPTAVCYDLFESPTATEEPPPGQRLVLVLGDEAVAGAHLARQFRATTELELGADVTTVSRVVPGTSLDAQYLLAVREIPRLHPELIVLFPNEANDLDELGRRYGCCGDKPLLELPATGTPTVACKEAMPHELPGELEAWLLLSPWPYPLRVVAERSHALAAVLTGLDELRRRWSGLQPLDRPTRRAHYTQLLTALQALADGARVRLLVVGLPLRGEEDLPRRADSPVALARAAHLDVLDASERFADAVRLAEPLYTQRWAGNPQLGEIGHYLLAKWLSPQLKLRLNAK